MTATGAHRYTAELVCLADVKPERLSWLWPGRIARGKVHALSGDPGLGKSMLTVALAAHVTTGRPWPDGSPCERGSVLLIGTEDGLADTVRPRLDAAGADAARVQALTGAKDRQGRSLAFDLQKLDALREALEGLDDCRLVIIDPVSAFLGDADAHKNSEVRALLRPLAELCELHGAAVVMVSHLSKSSQTSALHRSLGSVAFVGAARAAFIVARDPETADRRLVLPTKNNLGPDRGGFAFRIAAEPGGTARACLEAGEVHLDADQVLADLAAKAQRPSANDPAVRFLRESLADGPAEAARFVGRGKGSDFQPPDLPAGLTPKMLRNAKDALGVEAFKSAFGGGWCWRLPGQCGDPADPFPDQEHAKATEGSGAPCQAAQDAAAVPAPSVEVAEI